MLIGCENGDIFWFTLPSLDSNENQKNKNVPTDHMYDRMIEGNVDDNELNGEKEYGSSKIPYMVEINDNNDMGNNGDVYEDNGIIIYAKYFKSFSYFINDLIFVDFDIGVDYLSCLGSRRVGSYDMKDAGSVGRNPLSTHLCIISGGEIHCIGINKVCDIVCGDEQTLPTKLYDLSEDGQFHQNNRINHTDMNKNEYIGIYNHHKNNELAFMTLKNGKLYASILSMNLNEENRAILSENYLVSTDSCPYILGCKIICESDISIDDICENTEDGSNTSHRGDDNSSNDKIKFVLNFLNCSTGVTETMTLYGSGHGPDHIDRKDNANNEDTNHTSKFVDYNTNDNDNNENVYNYNRNVNDNYHNYGEDNVLSRLRFIFGYSISNRENYVPNIKNNTKVINHKTKNNDDNSIKNVNHTSDVTLQAIQEIISSIDKSVSTERYMRNKIKVIDIENLQMISLLNLLDENHSPRRYLYVYSYTWYLYMHICVKIHLPIHLCLFDENCISDIHFFLFRNKLFIFLVNLLDEIYFPSRYLYMYSLIYLIFVYILFMYIFIDICIHVYLIKIVSLIFVLFYLDNYYLF